MLHRIITTEPLLYKFVKEKFYSEECFFQKLQDENENLLSSFNNDPILLGIALGYGEKNSRLFHRRCVINTYLDKPSFCFRLPSPRFILYRSCHSKYVFENEIPPVVDTMLRHSLEEEWQAIEKSLVEFDPPSPLILFEIPAFIASKGKETDNIIKQFTIARSKISRLFQGKTYRQAIIIEASKQLES